METLNTQSEYLTIPPFWKKEWLQDVIKELNLSSMSALSIAYFGGYFQ
jgi:hypothetical protein